MIYIHKGDSTVFADVKSFLTFNLATELDLTGWTAVFTLQTYKKEFEDITAKTFCVNLTSMDTSKFYFGECYGTLMLIDNNGNVKTICNTIQFNVTGKVIENASQTIELKIPKCGDIGINVQVGAEYVTKEKLEASLELKQDKGDYATNDALAKGLATKQPTGDYATKTYVAQLIATIPQFKLSIKQELPTVGERMVLYLVPKTNSQTNDIYDEYIWIEEENRFEWLTSTAVDLTDYLTADKLGVAKVSQPMTSAEYEILETKDENTLYLIKED